MKPLSKKLSGFFVFLTFYLYICRKQKDMEEKWVFIKPFSNTEGTIPEGTELYFFRGQIYMNGGLIAPSYQQFLKNFIDNANLNREYLRKVRVIQDKV